ncbi:MAG: DUF4395 domain-containing protein [Bacteroidales bacterium]|nr:DUF4395 domain-containing protein [Bacteroidales bacterium]
MKLTAICPISDKKINERVSRVNAMFTVLLVLVFIYTRNILPIVFLSVDFLFRAADYSRYSLVAITSKNIVKYLPVKKQFINAGPKIFAARIGLALSSLILLSFLLSFTRSAFVLSGILGLFSMLEAICGLCVACKIYPFVYKILYPGRFNG